MPRYRVKRKEIHISTVEVEADDPRDALHRVTEDEGEELSCEYSHTLPLSSWGVEDLDGSMLLDPFRLKKGGSP